MKKENCEYISGSLKVWDFSAGQEWKELRGETDEDELGDNMSILGLQYCDIEGKRCLLVLGWNNALRLYLVSNIICNIL